MKPEEIAATIRSNFTPGTIDPGVSYSVSQQFTDAQNHPAGIRAPHALEALRDAQSVDIWAMDENADVILGLSRPTKHRPYAALIGASRVPSNPQPFLTEAWRLYGETPATATEALAWLIATFGIELSLDGTPGGLFIARAEVSGPEGISGSAASSFQLSTSFKLREDGTGEIAWAYAIDMTAYQKYVSSNR